MTDLNRQAVDSVVEAVRGSAKYRNVMRELVRRIAAEEVGKHRRVKEAVKSTKNKLHQVAAAYLTGSVDYEQMLDEIRRAAATGPEALRVACATLMGNHASTRERLGILDSFYRVILAGLPPIRSVLDLACGLNPLALPWMGLTPNVRYYACDVYEDLVSFLNRYFAIVGITGEAWLCDLVQGPPARRVDLAFLLKTVPCLEQVNKAAGARLLEGVRASYLLVSFPARSLGGRQKGMAANYEARFRDLIAGRPWSYRKLEFGTELAFLVTTEYARPRAP